MIQFLAQTGPREVTHFVIIARTNTTRMHAGQPLKITPQKQATGMLILAFETLREGVLQCCTEGIIPVQQRDMLLKEIEQGQLDSNRPSAFKGQLVSVELWRSRRVTERADVRLRVDFDGKTVVVEGQPHTYEVIDAIEETAEEIAHAKALWYQEDGSTEDGGIRGESRVALQAFIKNRTDLPQENDTKTS